MKNHFKIALTALTLISVAVFFNGCKKNSDTTVSDQQAASIVSSTVSSNSGGMAYDLTQAVAYPAQYGYKTKGGEWILSLPCNTPQSNPISWSDTLGGYYFDYSGNTTYELNCTGGNPTTFTVNNGYSGAYSYGSAFSGSINDTSSWTISQLGGSYTAYVSNGTYDQTGSYKISSGGKNESYSYSLVYNANNINIDKTSQQITTGSASMSVSVSLNGGSVYNFTGNIQFNNGTATITVGSYTTTVPY